MARNFAWLAVLGVALLVAQVAAANYVIDVLVPESGVTGSDAAAYQQWRAAAELAEADVNALWASSSDTLTINVLNNLNNGALNSQRAQDTTAIAVIGAGSTALTEQAALILQSRGISLLAPTLRAAVDPSLDNLFSLVTPYEHSHEVTADIFDRFGWSSLGLLYGRDEESVALLNAFRADTSMHILAEMEMPSTVPTNPGQVAALFNDFQPAMSRFTIASNNIYVMTWKNTAAMMPFLYASEVATGLNGLTKAWIWMDVPDEFIPMIPYGALICRPTPANATEMEDFLTRLRASESNSALTLEKHSMYVYDAVMVAAKAIKNAGGTPTASQVRDQLKTISYDGVTGRIEFRPNGHRETQRYDILNQVPRANYTTANIFVPSITAALMGSTRYTQVSFVHDHNGLSEALIPPIWPGRTFDPTPGNITTWPIAFMSRLPATPTFGVPMTRPEMVAYGRWIMDFLNDRSGILPPYTRLSMPPIDDSGTAAGAVKSAATFQSFGFVGVVGSDTTEISVAIQNIISAFSIPQISHGGTGSLLSDKTEYPTFFRTVGSDTVQMAGLVELAKHLQWDNLAVIATGGSYGSDLMAGLVAAAGQAGLPLSLARTIPPGSDIRTEVEAFAAENPYIVVVLGEPRDVMEIRQYAKEFGFAPRAWLAPAKFMSANLTAVIGSYPGLEVSDFDGFVGMAPGLNFSSVGYQEWWSELNHPTTGASALVKNICAIQQLYCAYVYDSIMAMAMGIKQVVLDGTNPRTVNILRDAILSVNENLATGKVSFDANYDRQSSPFTILNRRAGVSEAVGGWNADPLIGLSHGSIIWPDGSDVVPLASDPPVLKYLEWKSAAAIVLATLAAIGIIISIVIFAFVWQQSDSPIIRTATWEFLLVILFGCALGFGSMYTWIGEPKDWICALRIWLPPLAYVIVLAPLIAKTWRLHKIFTLGSLKVVPIPFWKLCVIASALFLVQVIICIVWISIGTIKPMLIADKNERGSYYVVCSQNRNNQILSYVTYGYCGIITFAGAYLAFIVRKLPKDFNESRWIGFSMYNSLLFGALVLILGYSLRAFPRTVMILICAITLALVTGVLVFMFFPKMWDLIRHPEKRSGSGTRKSTPTGAFSSGHDSDNRSFRRHDYSRKPSFNGGSSELEERSKTGSREQATPQRRHDYSLRKPSHEAGLSATASTDGKSSKK
jgi:ABC-type branched-subunit amino acid transport system substrate-binding protein